MASLVPFTTGQGTRKDSLTKELQPRGPISEEGAEVSIGEEGPNAPVCPCIKCKEIDYLGKYITAERYPQIRHPACTCPGPCSLCCCYQCRQSEPSEDDLDQQEIDEDQQAMFATNTYGYDEDTERDLRSFFRTTLRDRKRLTQVFRGFLAELERRRNDDPHVGDIRRRHAALLDLHTSLMKVDRDAVYRLSAQPFDDQIGPPRILIPGLNDGDVWEPQPHHPWCWSEREACLESQEWIKERAIRRIAVELDCGPEVVRTAVHQTAIDESGE